ncbi:MAG: twin-arginine translocase TatA/TatE family subunit [Nitrosarchaeum sp.]|jgi:sec-independent protein translocase protein TatA|nr:twin-arginine translocase TatA/TatE family subunit [Nitrosarchaeum sp.]MBP0120375.1 twin-arginine translocase TatA/TatE family subunit [Nitrosarchaeum sp.]MBP0133352.1 twin-arginine translocase TatA/TatE family subunit [Nitrosarchaeum sp.]MDW7641073.1 twin-arginine translocase TatA/TatE family subunit [Nitrosarchaeum sp.]MSV26179.1 translocase [Nitrosarchaeum sp.]
MTLESIFLAMPGINEILVIVVIGAVIIFGAKKIPELAKTLGKAKGEFEKGKIEAEKELNDLKNKDKKVD